MVTTLPIRLVPVDYEKDALQRLIENYAWYTTHYLELYAEYPNRFVVIVNCEVVGVLDKLIDAYNFGVTHYGLGNFLLQQCKSEIEIQYR